MDTINGTVTTLIVIGIVFIIVLVVCHFLKPRAIAWIQSNGEEKISLSKNKLYHANGYMIQSNSDILLGSTGSFKRFDSVDRDYKQIGQSSLTSPTWNIPLVDQTIPPQPLRPAPAPLPANIHKSKTGGLNKSFEDDFKVIKQQHSLDRTISTSVIPRPSAKRQLSQPITSTSIPLNLSTNLFNITKLPRLCTNPFLNGTIEKSSSMTNDLGSTNMAGIHTAETDFIKRQSATQLTHPSISSTSSISSASLKNPFRSIQIDSSASIDYENDIVGIGLAPRSTSSDATTPHFDLSSGGSIPNQQYNHSHSEEEEDVFVEMENKKNRFLFLLTHLDMQTNEVQPADSGGGDGSSKTVNQQSDKSNSSKSLVINHMLLDNQNKEMQQSRARSLSETDFILDSSSIHQKAASSLIVDQISLSLLAGNPFVKPKLQKTLSENYLNQYNMSGGGSKMAGSKMNRKNSLLHESSLKSLESNCSLESIDVFEENTSGSSTNVQRAMSCESVTSQSSILVQDLEVPVPVITGYLCIGLQYDKSSATELGQELIVTVLEAKELIAPSDTEPLTTFVRIYMVPDDSDAKQTKNFKNSTCPSYNESFSFWLSRKQQSHSLWFHLYSTNPMANILIGEAEMKLTNISTTLPVTTWLALSDSKVNKKYYNGELMFSLSYLPTAERLTIVVVKARNLKLNSGSGGNNNSSNSNISSSSCSSSSGEKNIYVKIYLLKNNKKVSKKKTMLKRNEVSPIYNESVIFSVPPYMLNVIQIRLTVMCSASDNSNSYTSSNSDKHSVSGFPIGHVIVGGGTTGKGLRHWHQMLQSLRKPVAMWHPLRLTNNNIL